jgi:hypothetical protein
MHETEAAFARVAQVLEAGHEMVAAARKAAGDDMDPVRLANLFLSAALHLIEDAHGKEGMYAYARLTLGSIEKVEAEPLVRH